MDIEVRSQFLQHIDPGKLTAKWSADGTRILRYYIDLRHKFLRIHKELSAPELFLLQHKVNALVSQWDQKTIEYQRRQKVVDGKGTAEQLSIEAAVKLESLQQILTHTLFVNDRVNWDALKDFSRPDWETRYPKAQPHRARLPEPTRQAPVIGFWDKLFGRATRKLQQAEDDYAHRRAEWIKRETAADLAYRRAVAAWTAEKASFEGAAEHRRKQFLDDQAAKNSRIDALVRGVAVGETQAVIEHATIVLEASNYKGLFEKSIEVDYAADSKTLLIEYELPSPDKMPTTKSVRFVASTGEVKETVISEREQKANYDAVCYQICLRTMHEVFEADEHNNIERVLFNGFAQYVDRATGKDVSSLIMSLLVNRNEFMAVDLSRVDPKACFKSLKGVSASSLSALAPIAPVMTMNKEDRRFIDARVASAGIDEATNLASMDWEDFEHLVREVFEKEFSSRGGEVKITQSSSDGGVDAVAFDPDPITGGKIVIQAKRYTRTVGVAAVRDLYGTMQHEMASRGILVTTADYGPDAHKFAAGKPITLMTGANLLHLLGKHGIKAKIDLREARKELNLREHPTRTLQ